MSLLNFCTLFDSGYLTRGLSLIESLTRTESNFHLYILTMDENSHNVITKLNIKNVSVISLDSFESAELLSIKASRTKGEYCWTCTPHLIKYCIDHFDLEHCTYLDADTYFFNSPRILLSENPSKSILITNHNYTPAYDQTVKSGKYCVQFMYFKNDQSGLTALNWWRDKCTEWCYARHEDGKFGDQKYLDDWPVRFNNVHELESRGGCLAPWNIQQFVVGRNLENITERSSSQLYQIGFYHFHDLKVYQDGTCDLGHYKISSDIVKTIYRPYLKSLLTNKKKLDALGFVANDMRQSPTRSPTYFIKKLKRWLNGNLNTYSIFKITGDTQ